MQVRNCGCIKVRTYFVSVVAFLGDYYQGTIWYSLFKYKPVVEFANMLNYTAFALGNHDFDDGIEGVIPFMKEANFPILAANIDASNTEFAQHVKKSITIEVKGHKIGK